MSLEPIAVLDSAVPDSRLNLRCSQYLAAAAIGLGWFIVLASVPPNLLAAHISAWAAPKIPRSPEHTFPASGMSLRVATVNRVVSGEAVDVKVSVENNGLHSRFVPVLQATWLAFPATWCWGPHEQRAKMLRFVRNGYRRPLVGSAARESVGPKDSYSLSPISFSHIFDLTLPGTYKAQLAGQGMVSNVIKFRVLPPRLKPPGEAITLRNQPVPKYVTAWGPARHGVQMAAYVKFNPNGNRQVRVRLFFRNTGHKSAAIHLTGNPEVDFANCHLIGPCYGKGRLAPLYRRINNKPTPLTAYGKMMEQKHWGHLDRQVYSLKPGEIYQYWRPLLLNRRFDLSIPAPYQFSARLAGTRLKTGTLTLYVGVQPRAYDKKLFERWLAHWKKEHGN